MKRISSGAIARRVRTTRLGQSPVLGIAMAVGVLIISGALVAGLRRSVALETRASFDWTTHTLEVENRLNAVVAAVGTAESAQRGFLLSGDSAYLDRMLPARDAAGHILVVLRRLTIDNVHQQRRLDTLGRLVDARLSLLVETAALSESGNRDSVERVIRNGRGRFLTDSIQATVRRAMAHEDSLLVHRQAAVEAALDRQALTEEFILGLAIVALLLAAAILFWLRRAERLVTMCAWSKAIFYEGEWMSIESYMRRRFGVSITHGISPDELTRLEAEMDTDTSSAVT